MIFASFISSIRNALLWLVHQIAEFFYDWVLWLFAFFKSLVDWIPGYLVSILPPSVSVVLDPLIPYLRAANQFIPFDYGFAIFAYYYTFKALFVTVRVTFRLFRG
jgi:hypothetical protein